MKWCGMPSILYSSCLLILIILQLSALAAASRSSYGNYNYDMTTPQYTPDGRLLQVEYATKACMREDGSNPIVSVGINSPPSSDKNGSGGDTILIMATISSPTLQPSSASPSLITTRDANSVQKDIDTNTAEQLDENAINTAIKESHHQRTQYRIIEVPLSTTSTSSISTDTSSTTTILIGLSGLLSDATYLLQRVYSQLEEEQRNYGWHRLGSSPVGVQEIVDDEQQPSMISLRRQSQSMSSQPSETTLRLSRIIADECQTHAFGGGLRPLGASLLLASVDSACITDENSKNNKMHGGMTRVAMCETYPNGGCRSQVVSGEMGLINVPKIMISGGPIKAQQRLKSFLTTRLPGVYQKPVGVETSAKNDDNKHVASENIIQKGVDDESTFLRRALQTVILSLEEEWRSRGDDHLSTSSPSGRVNKSAAFPKMEVVVSTAKRGTFRLTDSDIARLRSKIK